MADESRQATVKATYDQDSKRYHRYIIDEGQGIVGNIYIPKTVESAPIKVIIELQVKGNDGR